MRVSWGMACLALVACVGDQPAALVDAGMPDTSVVPDAGGDTSPPDSGCGDTNTSHDNCGKCGNVCGTTENCFDGTCDGDKLVDVSAGTDQACVVMKSGAVYCWGANNMHQLAADSGATTCAGGIPCSPKALRVVGVSDAVQIDVGDETVCVVRATGAVACWGANTQGQLGHTNGDDTCGGYPCNKSPTDVLGLPPQDPAVQVVAGGRTTAAIACARTKAGAVFCWGDNSHGLLGNTTLTPAMSSSPVPVVGVQTGAQAIAASDVGGNIGVCAVMGDKTLRCWGGAYSWMTGRDPSSANGTCGCFPDAAAPTLAGADNMLAVAVADAVTVGLHPDGTVVAWGFTGYAVNPSVVVTPVAAIAGLPPVAALAAAAGHACARTSGGDVWCWGINLFGAVGNGDFTGDTTCISSLPCWRSPRKVAGLAATRLAAGADFTVAIGDHSAFAWGSNTYGRLGHPSALDVACGNSTCAPLPMKVEGLPGTK